MRKSFLNIILLTCIAVVGISCHKSEVIVNIEQEQPDERVWSLNYFDTESPDDLALYVSGDDIMELQVAKSFLQDLNYNLVVGDILTMWPSFEQKPEYMRIQKIENHEGKSYFYGSKLHISQVLTDVDYVFNTQPWCDDPSHTRGDSSTRVLHPVVLHVSPQCLKINGQPVDAVQSIQYDDIAVPHGDVVVLDLTQIAKTKSSISDIEIVFHGNETFKCNSTENTNGNNVGVDVNWSFNPYTNVRLDVMQRELNNFEILFDGEFTIESNLNIVNTLCSCNCEKSNISLTQTQTYQAIFMVGDIPVAIDVSGDVMADVAIAMDQGVDLNVPVKFMGSFSTGMHFETGRGWNSIRESEHQNEHPNDLQDANITTSVDLKAKTKIAINLITTVGGSARFEAILGPTLNLGVSTTEHIGGGLEFDAYGSTVFDVCISTDLTTKSWNLSPWKTSYVLYTENLFTDRWTFQQ